MDDRILINPENRTLGTSGSNDFSLYGAQPDPALTIGPAPFAEASEEDHSEGSAGPDPLQIQAPAQAASDPAESADSAPATPASAGGPVAALQSVPSAPAASAESGGSITPIFPATSLASFDATGLTAPSIAAPSSETAPQDPTNVASTAVPVVQDFDAASAAAPIAASASSLVEALPLEAAGQVLPGLAAEIVPADPLAPVADGVQDLLGADPAAGIATLVSLVSISDVLDLGAVVTEGADAAVDPAADLIDMLAMDATGELAPLTLGDDESDGADALLGLPLAPPDDPLDDALGL